MKNKSKTWLEVATNDLNFAESILENGNYPQYSVHFCHQSIEKILKAIIQEFTIEEPKRTHNFKILCQQAKLELPANLENILARLAPHYLASKYPEDLERLYKVYTMSYSKQILKDTKELFLWLRQYLISEK